MIHTKRCKDCKCLFDIATNYDLCPECRRRDLKLNKETDKRNGNK